MEYQKIEDKSLCNAGLYLVSLIGKALRNEIQILQPEGCTWEQVYGLAVGNSVEAVSFYGLDIKLVPGNIYTKWQEQANVTLFRQLSFDMEREKILKELEKAEISYVPLKGINIVGLYPKPGMRSMADNDILYKYIEKKASEKEAQMVVCEIMKKLEYEVENLQGNHDNYVKEPCYNFEMHRQLMSSNNPLYSYYENIWEKAIRDVHNKYKYTFSDSDEYIYLVAHTYKHFTNFGCGIRSIVDQYVFLNKKRECIDWGYVNNELMKMGIYDFEEKLKSLSIKAFDGQKLDKENEDMLFYMFGCGTYGYYDNYMNNALNKIKSESGKGYKIKYILQRLFLSKEQCKTLYPFFYKNYWLIWFLPVYRLARVIIFRPKYFMGELIRVFKHK